MPRRALLWPGPVEAGARAISARHLGDAERALARLPDAVDVEALHDFRVALRRLRSCMRAYRAHLDPRTTPEALEGAGDLASRTGIARDAEVQIEWLRTHLDGKNAARRAAAGFLIRALETLVARAQLGLRSGLERDFGALVAELRPALSTYSAPVSALGPLEGRSFGEVSAELLRSASQQLVHALGSVSAERDEEPAHRARIEAKRLRYLLEPLEKEVRGVTRIIQRLRRLQDLLGELNDLRVQRASLARALERVVLMRAQHRMRALEESSGDPARDVADRALEEGILSLARFVHGRRHALFGRLAREWLGEAPPQRVALAAETAGLAERLAQRRAER